MYNIKDKEVNLFKANNYTLAKTLSMFEWENLPETLPVIELEKMLQSSGFCFITEHEGKIYGFTGGLGGVPDVYNNPTQIVVSNPALNLNKTYNLENDGVLIYSDDMKMGLFPIIDKYNSFLVESDINLQLAGINSRLRTAISASDDKTKQGAETYIQKLVDGELSVIGEAALFDGVKVHGGNSGQGNGITPLVELHQYYKASLSNELGLNSNFNMKRERLNTSEVEQAEDVLFPFVDNMMKCRIQGVDKLNEKYGLEIKVGYGSIWNRKNKEMNDGIVDDEKGVEKCKTTDKKTESENSNESLPESLNESGAESLNESSNESSSDGVEPEQEGDQEPGEPTGDQEGDQEPGEPTGDQEGDQEPGEPTGDQEGDQEPLDLGEAETLAEQLEQAETMLTDETLTDEDREALTALIEELKRG